MTDGSGVKIAIVANKDDETLTELHLPDGAEVVIVGATEEEFAGDAAKDALASCTVLLNCIGGRALISSLWPRMPNLKWMHSRFAGVDHVLFPELVASRVPLTNARGLFSSALAEYVALACLYFAKDVDRWKAQQRDRVWEKFVVQEIRGQTLGVLGYGDIGQSAARLAKALGMRVLAQRRNAGAPPDGIADETFGPDGVGDVVARSDYVCVAAALTPETRGMLGAAALARARPHTVIINVGRGPLIDEAALAEALREGRVRGAALDVFETEPLPRESALWGMRNVLLSPHNADMTATFLHDSVRRFAQDAARFARGEPFTLHVVDKEKGY
eukprot:TRINITY_DN5064_c0_g1_i1.p1 TRINITY_DN5064_c0_g1~~TRINITY_DN5064_c0_g1_i1.p1  ORF type:complete len:374 (+),score=133.13 TRINITY_DN5064_c0_g1_i1:131-1123(+)